MKVLKEMSLLFASRDGSFEQSNSALCSERSLVRFPGADKVKMNTSFSGGESKRQKASCTVDPLGRKVRKLKIHINL